MSKVYKNILNIKKELTKLNQERILLYEEKKKLREEIRALLSELKKLKEERNKYTSIIDSLMNERKDTLDRLNNIKQKLEALKAKKKDIGENKDLIININKYKRDLERLEYILQTEVLSYDQEKKIWNKIKHLRKLLGKYEAISTILEEIDKTREEYRALRSKLVIIGENIRKNINQRAEIKKKAKEIKEKLQSLFEKRNNINKRLLEIKETMLKLENDLKENLEKYLRLLNEFESRENIQIDASEKDEIIKKYEEIQQKLLKGENISTTEILILQKYEILKKRGVI